jgi:hypothetical protein
MEKTNLAPSCAALAALELYLVVQLGLHASVGAAQVVPLGCVVNRLLTEMCTQCLLGCAGHCVSKLIFIPTDLVVKTYNCVQLQNAGSANDASSEFRELLCAVICDYRRKLF